MTLAEPTLPKAAEIIRTARFALDGRAVFHGVPWSLYESLLDEVGDGWPRLTYDDGDLELIMPSRVHEKMKWMAGRFIEAYMDARGTAYEADGSVTLRLEPRRGGLEPDECYYIQSFAAIAGRDELDLAVDPPPDLAIEIELSPPAVGKVSIYARLGVPEIWRWRDGRLAVLERRPDETYVERSRSVALPDFPLHMLAAQLARRPHPSATQAVAEFRKWCDEGSSQP